MPWYGITFDYIVQINRKVRSGYQENTSIKLKNQMDSVTQRSNIRGCTFPFDSIWDWRMMVL